MWRTAAITALALILGGLLWLESERAPARVPVRESCLACHNNTGDPGPGHPVSALGCACCHLGNPMAFEAGRAHAGMVLNPGDLRVAGRTCGRQGCHPGHPGRVESSVMAGNQGILASLYRLWDTPEADRITNARLLLGTAGPRPLPADYYAKLCASCHLWRPLPGPSGPFPERGGGCSACHVTGRGDKDKHPGLTARVPMANCLRCHNRSARIGLSYQGMAEDDGYGTPHAAGGPNPRTLTGGRHYWRIPPDVHFQAGMVCIDCHTEAELMGTGREAATLEDQLDVACEDCHMPVPGADPDVASRAARLAGTNRRVPKPLGGVAVTRRGASPLYALRLLEPANASAPGRAVLHRKLDGSPIAFALSAPLAEHHGLPGHERLACQACHSPLMPQCHGCHVRMVPEGSQFDNFAEARTPGRWVETRSHARLERPALGVARSGLVAPFSPCRVEVEGRAPASLDAVSSFDPHTTRTRSRTCLDCHADPRSLGLGHGRLLPGRAGSRPTLPGPLPGPGRDGQVDLQGRLHARFPQGGDRPFTAGELRAVLAVAPCLPCHGRYDDPLWRDFRAGIERLARGGPGACAMPKDVQIDNLFHDSVLHATRP